MRLEEGCALARCARLDDGGDDRGVSPALLAKSRRMETYTSYIQYTTNIALRICAARIDAPPTTWRAFNGSMLFESVVESAQSLSRYLSTPKSGSQYPANLSGVATLSRALTEAGEVFHYHYLDRMSQDEWELRLAVRSMHEHREELDVRRLLKLEKLDDGTGAPFLSHYHASQICAASAKFASLSKGAQDDILAGKRAKTSALPSHTRPYNMSESEYKGAYKLLSNCCRFSSLGDRAGRTTGPAVIDTNLALTLCLHLGIHCLAWTIDKYVNRRRALAGLFSRDERRVVGAFAEANLGTHVIEPHAGRMVDAPARKLRELVHEYCLSRRCV